MHSPSQYFVVGHRHLRCGILDCDRCPASSSPYWPLRFPGLYFFSSTFSCGLSQVESRTRIVRPPGLLVSRFKIACTAGTVRVECRHTESNWNDFSLAIQLTIFSRSNPWTRWFTTMLSHTRKQREVALRRKQNKDRRKRFRLGYRNLVSRVGCPHQRFGKHINCGLRLRQTNSSYALSAFFVVATPISKMSPFLELSNSKTAIYASSSSSHYVPP